MKHALRQLAKSPGFTVVALLTLALGIGLNTSMFSLLNKLLLEPLHLPEKDQLIRIHRTTQQSDRADHTTSDFLELARASADFAQVAGYRMWSISLAESGRPPVNLHALRVTPNFFSILGIRPHLGRFFNPDEDTPGSNVIVLAYDTWQAQFGGDPAIVGRTVRIDGEPTTVVGIAPVMPGTILVWGPGEAFRPLAATPAEKIDRGDAKLAALARIPPTLTLPQLNARLATIAEHLAQQRPPEQRTDGLRAVPLEASIHNTASQAMSWMMLALASFVLLIACANLANLQLVRALARSHEFAIRAALGASRGRLLRPLLVESVLLAFAGGVLGILVATWANDWITSRVASFGLTHFHVTIEWNVLLFAFLVSLATGVAFGLAPAWFSSRIEVGNTLKSGGRGNTGDRTQHRFRHALIIGQFALALVLLVGAGVFVRGLDTLLGRDVGWNRDNLLQGIINLPQAKYATPEQAYRFQQQLQERLAGLPDVESVAVGWTLPIFQFLSSRHFVVDGREPPPAGREPLAFVNGVTPSYLPTLGVKLLAGRNFTDADHATAPRVALISESTARALFPNEDPVGRRIGNPDPANRAWLEIVGVIPDLRLSANPTKPVTPFLVLLPLAQDTWNYVSVAIRSSRAETLVDPMRRVLAELDPDLPMQQVGTVQQQTDAVASSFRLTNTLLISFALLGLFLAAIGLYGVITRLVVQRTPEIGIRVALGAQSRDVVWLVLRSGVKLILIGTVLGLTGSVLLIFGISAVMPEYPVKDPIAVSFVTVLLLAIALFASWLPSYRASKVDPLIALRSE